MNRKVLIIFAALSCPAVLSAQDSMLVRPYSAAPPEAHSQDASASLNWLAGCWEARSRDRVIEEQWMVPRGGVLLGMSRTTRGDSLIEYERMRIFTRAGVLVFAAEPSGQAPAEFRAARMELGQIEFENPAHDFPQRIRYRAVGADSLRAEIEGTAGGRTRQISFSYKRARCGVHKRRP